ncbi:hypothetical protein GGF46_004632 [Coemansia sp. RSA 552]|nr:hypothetical protein GGF46_004632 [Coemansia sp. RSA 552]
MDVSRLQALVKPLLRAVLMKVHPDFFTHQPAAKATNHSSVQRLQDLLAPVLAEPSGPEPHKRSQELTTEPLTFINRGGSADESPVVFAFGRRSGRSLDQLQAQRARDMLGLCSALGVKVDSEIVREIKELVGRGQPQGLSGPTSEALARLRQARAREARQNYERSRSAPDPHEEMMGKLRMAGWSPSAAAAKTARLQLNRRLLFFAADVSPKRYSAVVQQMESQLHDLGYGSWSTLPVMVVNKWKDALAGGASPRYPGFVIYPDGCKKNGKLSFCSVQVAGDVVHAGWR